MGNGWRNKFDRFAVTFVNWEIFDKFSKIFIIALIFSDKSHEIYSENKNALSKYASKEGLTQQTDFQAFSW